MAYWTRLKVRLSKNFTLAEFCKSSTADRLGIDNVPTNQEYINNIQLLVNKVLQPVRDYFGLTIITSGYRVLALNRAIGSKDTSQHTTGQAVDFEVPGIDNAGIAQWVADNCEFDQLILEFYTPGQPQSGWVHCSLKPDGSNRRQKLTINKSGTYTGLLH